MEGEGHVAAEIEEEGNIMARTNGFVPWGASKMPCHQQWTRP